MIFYFFMIILKIISGIKAVFAEFSAWKKSAFTHENVEKVTLFFFFVIIILHKRF